VIVLLVLALIVLLGVVGDTDITTIFSEIATDLTAPRLVPDNIR